MLSANLLTMMCAVDVTVGTEIIIITLKNNELVAML